VVYLAIEVGHRAIQNRVYAWLQRHGLEQQDIPFAAVTTPVDLCHLNAGDVPLLISTIKQQVGFSELALLEIDTLGRALAGGDENAPTDIGGDGTLVDLPNLIEGAVSQLNAVIADRQPAIGIVDDSHPFANRRFGLVTGLPE
jgi:hypothetical protein